MALRLSLALHVLCAAASLSPLPAQQSPGSPGRAPTASTHTATQPDTLYAQVRARLTGRGYRIDEADARSRRLVVRAPGDDTRVEVRITARGDSSAVSVAPAASGDLVRQMRALLIVTHDATMERPEEAGRAPAAGGELPPSRWLPELFVTPAGRLWMARGGLYTADSAAGAWRRVFPAPSHPVGADEIRTGIAMAFPAEDTALVGLPSMARRSERDPLLYRTTDGGRTWVPVAVPPELAWVDDMAAEGSSVWLLGTRWVNKTRRAAFLQSTDGGATWRTVPVPDAFNDVTRLTRVSPDTAYVATAGFNDGPVFWRTTDGGAQWAPVPTPHDQRAHRVPDYGVRIESVATVGDWLVVREYGKVFVTRADSIAWRPLNGVRYVAGDHERDRLFVLTDSLEAAALDRNLRELWRTKDRIPDARPSNIEKVLAHAGVGYVATSQSTVYEARDGVLRLVRPRGAPSSAR